MMRSKLKKYFIPYQENNYKPHILQRAAVLVMLLLILIGFATANMQALLLLSSNTFISAILPAVIVDLTNENRESESLSSLTRNPLLDYAAELKAAHMAEYEYFSHDSPDGLTPWYWFDQAGYTYSFAGENLAVHFTDSQEVVDAWMESPGHRKNILEQEYSEIGLGTARGEYKGFPTIYVVQLFGRPAVITEVPKPTPSAISVIDIPAPEAAEPVVVEDPVVETAKEESSVPEEITEIPEIEIAEEDTPVLLSELSTTTGLAPVSIGDGNGETVRNTRESTIAERILTQPTSLLMLIYTLLASFVVVALVLSIGIEWRRQHPVQIAYGTGLLAAMAVMLLIQEELMSGALII